MKTKILGCITIDILSRETEKKTVIKLRMTKFTPSKTGLKFYKGQELPLLEVSKE